jgi:hypothetical protein
LTKANEPFPSSGKQHNLQAIAANSLISAKTGQLLSRSTKSESRLVPLTNYSLHKQQLVSDNHESLYDAALSLAFRATRVPEQERPFLLR